MENRSSTDENVSAFEVMIRDMTCDDPALAYHALQTARKSCSDHREELIKLDIVPILVSSLKLPR